MSTDLVIAAPGRGAIATELRSTLSLAWPLVLTNVAQMAITTTDVVMLGWFSADALAAATLGVNVYYAFFISGIGIAVATSPMLAQAIGRGRHVLRDLRRTVRQGLWAMGLIALPVWAVLWHTEDLLLAMGQAPHLARAAGEYVRVLQWGLVSVFWFTVLRCFIAARERPQAALYITLGGIGLNAVLCWGLIFGNLGMPRLGLVGAGYASLIAQTAMFAALVGFVFIDRDFRRHQLFGRFWRADWPRFLELWRIGTPIAGAMLFEVTVFNAAVFIMGLIDTAQLAAHAIAIQVAAITFMVPMGIGQAATVRVGLFAGAGDRLSARRAGWVAISAGTVFMVVAAVVLFAVPGPIAYLFLDRADPASAVVAGHAAAFLAVAGLFQIVDGMQVTAAGALRGLKDTTVPALYAGFGYWVAGLPFGAWLAFGLGFQGLGIWIGLAAGIGIVAVLMTARWARRSGT